MGVVGRYKRNMEQLTTKLNTKTMAWKQHTTNDPKKMWLKHLLASIYIWECGDYK
jgi:hypothetical protein